MYYNTKADMYQMFVDETAGETGNLNRLATARTEQGSVALVAYAWQQIAEYNPRRNAVTVFYGHTGISETVDRYLDEIAEFAAEADCEVIESGASPLVGEKPPECIDYAGEFIDWSTSLSGVEKKAREDVHSILKSLY